VATPWRDPLGIRRPSRSRSSNAVASAGLRERELPYPLTGKRLLPPCQSWHPARRFILGTDHLGD
jgi:hypothetical protein